MRSHCADLQHPPPPAAKKFCFGIFGDDYMYRIWIDDERPTPQKEFDASAKTADNALKIIRKKYKEGIRNFFLDIDNDAGENQKEFYYVLSTVETLCHTGKMKDTNFNVRIHTGNSVARNRMRQLIEANENFKEVL